MKQYVGDDIRRIMAEMPAQLVEALRTQHPEHHITEYEARWWGFLQFARTGAYEGQAFVTVVNGTDEELVERFVPYTLDVRSADRNARLVRRPWPESGFDPMA